MLERVASALDSSTKVTSRERFGFKFLSRKLRKKIPPKSLFYFFLKSKAGENWAR